MSNGSLQILFSFVPIAIVASNIFSIMHKLRHESGICIQLKHLLKLLDWLDWFIIKSHRSKILNCIIIYQLLIYNYKYNALKFY